MKDCFIFFLLWLSFSSLKSEEERKLHFFLLDIHSSVSADVVMMIEHFGHKVTFWSLSPFSKFAFGRENDPLEFITKYTFEETDEDSIEKFVNRYESFLKQFDAFIVPHNAAFAILYERFNKPILIQNSCRYEIPFTRKPQLWSKVNKFLIKGVSNKKIFISSNNKADQYYLKYYTGLDSVYIPSLSLYTNAYYTGINDQFICQKGPAHLYTYFQAELPKLLKNPNLVHETLKSPYAYQDLYNYKGIIHFPYQISTMSLFEEYSANVPLFIPSKTFLLKLYKQKPEEVLVELSYFFKSSLSKPKFMPGEPNNILDPNVLKKWIDHADFYDEENMPFIHYFDSFEDLEHLLLTVNLQETSQKMREHNIKRKEMVLQKWEDLLDRVICACRASALKDSFHRTKAKF